MVDKKYKIYLAAPLFNAAERQFNVSLAWRLRDFGHTVWLPQENQPAANTPNWEAEVFAKDLEGINAADVVIASMEGPDPDSGTAWEVGYAYGIKKPVIAFRTDFRQTCDGSASYNIMLYESATLHVAATDFDVQQLGTKLCKALDLL